MTDERSHDRAFLLERRQLKLVSNRVAYLPAWRNEFAQALWMPKVGR